MHQETIDILLDLIDWLNQLKADRYFNRRLNGCDQSDYMKLNKSLDKASRYVEALKHMQDHFKNAP
jgi:hypothetical protein